MFGAPRIQFFADKFVNLFYHISVLFSEYFPEEYSHGILNNVSYQRKYKQLKAKSLRQRFEQLQHYSYYTWDFIGKSLSRTRSVTQVKEKLEKTSRNLMGIWLEILSEASPSYESIWAEIEGKLNKYKLKFDVEWNSIHNSVLTKMSDITKLPWKPESISVHLVDCVHGAQSWAQDVVLPPFPNVDVEKKLLTHEIAHILIPNYFLETKLRSLGLDLTLSHTIVDLTAYFSIKKHVTDPERLGIKPNPDYYPEVQKLYPIFEDCYRNPRKYQDFDEILKQIVP